MNPLARLVDRWTRPDPWQVWAAKAEAAVRRVDQLNTERVAAARVVEGFSLRSSQITTSEERQRWQLAQDRYSALVQAHEAAEREVDRLAAQDPDTGAGGATSSRNDSTTTEEEQPMGMFDRIRGALRRDRARYTYPGADERFWAAQRYEQATHEVSQAKDRLSTFEYLHAVDSPTDFQPPDPPGPGWEPGQATAEDLESWAARLREFADEHYPVQAAHERAEMQEQSARWRERMDQNEAASEAAQRTARQVWWGETFDRLTHARQSGAPVEELERQAGAEFDRLTDSSGEQASGVAEASAWDAAIESLAESMPLETARASFDQRHQHKLRVIAHEHDSVEDCDECGAELDADQGVDWEDVARHAEAARRVLARHDPDVLTAAQAEVDAAAAHASAARDQRIDHMAREMTAEEAHRVLAEASEAHYNARLRPPDSRDIEAARRVITRDRDAAVSRTQPLPVVPAELGAVDENADENGNTEASDSQARVEQLRGEEAAADRVVQDLLADRVEADGASGSDLAVWDPDEDLAENQLAQARQAREVAEREADLDTSRSETPVPGTHDPKVQEWLRDPGFRRQITEWLKDAAPRRGSGRVDDPAEIAERIRKLQDNTPDRDGGTSSGSRGDTGSSDTAGANTANTAGGVGEEMLWPGADGTRILAKQQVVRGQVVAEYCDPDGFVIGESTRPLAEGETAESVRDQFIDSLPEQATRPRFGLSIAPEHKAAIDRHHPNDSEVTRERTAREREQARAASPELAQLWDQAANGERVGMADWSQAETRAVADAETRVTTRDGAGEERDRAQGPRPRAEHGAAHVGELGEVVPGTRGFAAWTDRLLREVSSPGLSHHERIQHLDRYAGRAWDPDAVKAAERLARSMEIARGDVERLAEPGQPQPELTPAHARAILERAGADIAREVAADAAEPADRRHVRLCREAEAAREILAEAVKRVTEYESPDERDRRHAAQARYEALAEDRDAAAQERDRVEQDSVGEQDSGGDEADHEVVAPTRRERLLEQARWSYEHADQIEREADRARERGDISGAYEWSGQARNLRDSARGFERDARGLGPDADSPDDTQALGASFEQARWSHERALQIERDVDQMRERGDIPGAWERGGQARMLRHSTRTFERDTRTPTGPRVDQAATGGFGFVGPPPARNGGDGEVGSAVDSARDAVHGFDAQRADTARERADYDRAQQTNLWATRPHGDGIGRGDGGGGLSADGRSTGW